MHLGLKIIQRIIIPLFPFDLLKNGRSSSPVGRLDFKSRWGRQRSLAGSTPVIFRQFLFNQPSQKITFYIFIILFFSKIVRLLSIYKRPLSLNTQAKIAELYGKDVRTINKYLVNIFLKRELAQNATIRKFRIVRQ